MMGLFSFVISIFSFKTKTSRWSLRFIVLLRTKPSFSFRGKSFIEWTAISIFPANSSFSISSIKRPFPPMMLKGLLSLSPLVEMIISSNSNWGYFVFNRFSTSLVWTRASFEPLVPIFINICYSLKYSSNSFSRISFLCE